MKLKRFVTYLYEYKSGQKTKNTGFIRVDIRNDKVNLEVCVRNMAHTIETGKIYGFVKLEDLRGIELGEVKVINGQSNTRLMFPKEDLNESGYTIEEISGVGICFPNQEYLASCWKDEIADEIGKKEFAILKTEEKEMQAAEIEEQVVLEELKQENEEENSIELHIEETEQKNRYTTYEKMELSEIRNLPSGNWHLCNNSFLVHGFFNYGYLILKKEVEEEKSLSLGVPGYFEKPEMVMAMVYGFPKFEPIPKEVIDMPMHVESISYEIEKNQRPETGVFGGWFVSLQD